MKYKFKSKILILFLLVSSLSFSEKLNFEGEFKGNINYAESMGGFATEARQLEIVAYKIIQKDAEIKYYNLMLDKVNAKLEGVIKKAEEDELDEALKEFKNISTDLSMFNKNYVTNFRLIGNYQETMERLLKGNDLFGSGGRQKELLYENENMLIDYSRSLNKIGTILKENAKAKKFYMNEDKKKKKKEEMSNNLRGEVKKMTTTLGEFHQNSAMLSKVILDEIQNDNIKKLYELRLRKEKLQMKIESLENQVYFTGRGKDRLKKYKDYQQMIIDMSEKGKAR
jgi:hypothetical protein